MLELYNMYLENAALNGRYDEDVLTFEEFCQGGWQDEFYGDEEQ